MVFRGIIFNRIHKWLGDTQTILLCAILFALYHFNPVQGLYAFLMGLLISWNYNRYHKISTAFAVHAAANVSVIVMMGLWK
jgi:membrane protease YdiL (CAAX protease family)